jgi:hypothetical protein
VTDIVRHAKQILRDAGYMVIPRERHVVLKVDRSIDRFLVEQAYDTKSFLQYEEGVVAQALGRELMEKAVRRTDRGLSADKHRYERRWETEVILPK